MAKKTDLLDKIKPFFQGPQALVVGIYLLLLLATILKLPLATLILTLAFLSIVIAKNQMQLAFYLGVFSLSFDQIFVSVGFSLKIHMLVFLTVALGLIYKSIKNKKFPHLPPQAAVVAVLFLMVFSVISVWPAHDKVLAARFVASLFFAMSVLVLTFMLIRNRQEVIKTINFLIAGMIISVLVSLEQYFAFYFNLPMFGDVGIFNPGNFVRPAGIFDHPNFLANFLLVVLPITIGYTFWLPLKSLAKQFLVSISMVALIVTFSRAAYIGITFFAAVMLFFIRGTKQILAWGKYLAVILVFTIVGLGSLFYLVGPYSLSSFFGGGGGGNRVFLTRVTSSVDPYAQTNLERLLILQSGFKMLNDNWLVGVGLENFRVRYKEYKLPGAIRDEVVAHNTYFQLLIETGIFGAAAFAVVWLAVFWKNLKGIFKSAKNSFYYYILLGTLAALLGVTFQNLTNSVLYYPHTWFLYGFILAVSSLVLRER